MKKDLQDRIATVLLASPFIIAFLMVIFLVTLAWLDNPVKGAIWTLLACFVVIVVMWITDVF